MKDNNYFYLSRAGVKTGPHHFDNLKDQLLLSDDLIWSPKFGEDWKLISEVEELQGLYILTPPPLPGQKKLENLKILIEKYLKLFLKVFLLTGCFLYGAMYDFVYEVGSEYGYWNMDTFIYSFLYISLPFSLLVVYYKKSNYLRTID